MGVRRLHGWLGDALHLPLDAVAGLIAVGAIAALWSGAAGAQQSGLRPALLMLAVCGASAVLGGFVGFLFGIPRFDYAAREAAAASTTAARPGATAIAATSAATAGAQGATARAPTRYKPSANLDEIADWLTKIIVGLGLTQLLNVGTGLASIESYVVQECGGLQVTLTC